MKIKNNDNKNTFHEKNEKIISQNQIVLAKEKNDDGNIKND